MKRLIIILKTHELLENLLTWAITQNKTVVCNPLMLKVNDIVEKELKVLSQVAIKKLINIENNIPVNLEIYADLMMFETIIRNLVSNAIKYTFPNGNIKINAQMTNKEGKTFTEIKIIDNGVGLKEDQLSTLFSLSNNSSTKGTENEAGTGLGLVLCKEFIDLHGGAINAESKFNEGSTFICVFPMPD